MRKYLIVLAIFISIIAISFGLKVDVPVSVEISGKDRLVLNKQSFGFEIQSPDDFNSLALGFLTYNRPVGGSIEFSLYEDSSQKKRLVKHIFDKGGLLHAQLYKFNFKTLKANKKYYLVIKGEDGVPYKLLFDSGRGWFLHNTTMVKGRPVLKIYSAKSLIYVAFKSSQRAARNWFRLGWFYHAFILIYISLVSAVLASILWSRSIEKS